MPRQQAANRSYQLMRHIMEVNTGAGKHPHPNDYYEVQSDVQQVEDHPGQSRMADRLQVRHRLHLLHDKKGRIG